MHEYIRSDEIKKEKETYQQKTPKIKEISALFYEGFGFDVNEWKYNLYNKIR